MGRSIGKKGRNNRKRRSDETAEEKESRLDGVKSKLKKESEEDRNLRLNNNKEYMRQLRASQKYSQTGNTLQQRESRALEIPKKKKSRLKNDALRHVFNAR